MIVEISKNKEADKDVSLMCYTILLRMVELIDDDNSLKSYCKYAIGKANKREINKIISFEEFSTKQSNQNQVQNQENNQNLNLNSDGNFELLDSQQSPKSKITNEQRNTTEDESETEKKNTNNSQKDKDTENKGKDKDTENINNTDETLGQEEEKDEETSRSNDYYITL